MLQKIISVSCAAMVLLGCQDSTQNGDTNEETFSRSSQIEQDAATIADLQKSYEITPDAALSQTLERCTAITANASLAYECFLREKRAIELINANEMKRGQQWRFYENTDPITGFENVWLRMGPELYSDEHGRSQEASIIVRCNDNTTAMIVETDDFITTQDTQLTYRIDDAPAQTRTVATSTDYTSMGFWRGNQAIPVIKRLINAKKLVVRFTPHGESPATLTFNIDGLDKRIAPIRKACKW